MILYNHIITIRFQDFSVVFILRITDPYNGLHFLRLRCCPHRRSSIETTPQLPAGKRHRETEHKTDSVLHFFNNSPGY